MKWNPFTFATFYVLEVSYSPCSKGEAYPGHAYRKEGSLGFILEVSNYHEWELYPVALVFKEKLKKTGYLVSFTKSQMGKLFYLCIFM